MIFIFKNAEFSVWARRRIERGDQPKPYRHVPMFDADVAPLCANYRTLTIGRVPLYSRVSMHAQLSRFVRTTAKPFGGHSVAKKRDRTPHP
jgi:hypothetical protein